MKKVYCAFSDFNKNAIEKIKQQNVELFINKKIEKPNGEELINIIKEFDVIIIGVASILKKEMLKHIKTPKIIATLSVGLDHIDEAFFSSPLVNIINIKTANSVSVAEHVFSLILSLNKRIYESNNLVLNGLGHKNNLFERPEDISSKTLGLIGCGNINSQVINMAKAFNMNVICFTKNPDKHSNLKGVEFVSLNKILQQSDIINIAIPLTNETKNLINKERIFLMKKTATFINASRPEVVDINALIEYADLHKTFYVGLDIDVNNYKELLSKYRTNVIVTPHTAGVSKQALERMDEEIVDKIIDYLK